MFNFGKKNTITTDVLSILVGKYELVIFAKNRRIPIAIHASSLFDRSDCVKQIIENEILNSENINFYSIHFYFLTDLYTLVPSEIFDEKIATNFISATTPLYKFDKIYFSENSKNNLFVIFAILEDLEFFIKARTGRYSLDHIANLTLEKTPPKSKKVEFHVLLHKNEAEILCYNKKQLIDYNVIDFEKEEDLLYFLLVKLEDHSFDKIKTKFYVYGANLEQKKDLKTYVNLNFFFIPYSL